MALSGASPAEIQSHYDQGDEFFGLWLGEGRIYSCALWKDGDDNLQDAQERKLRFHLESLRLPAGSSILDIGCGWGSLLRIARRHFLVSRAVGLTLSANQWREIQSRADPGVEAHLQSWTEHEPAGGYDGLVSVGAFEHFARPEHSARERTDIYRAFFDRCRRWLKPRARLSLQTIAYGTVQAGSASEFMATRIFPGSELPLPQEITQAAQPYLGLLSRREDGLDYARTCETWLRNLQHHRVDAHRMVGAETTRTYERYLRLSAAGFRTGRLTLLRLLFQRSAGD